MSYSGNPQLYDGQTAKGQTISALGEALMTEPTRLVGPAFAGSLAIGGTASDNFWALAGSGTAVAGTVANNICTLTAPTDAGYVQVSSQRPARFLFANANKFRALIKFGSTPSADTNCTTYIGQIALSTGTPGPGYCFAVSSTGVVSVQAYSASGVTTLNTSTLNGAVTSYTVADANAHAFEIMYFAAKVWYYIDGVMVHSAAPTTALLVPDLTQKIGVATKTSGAAVARVVQVWFATTLRYGKEVTRPLATYIAANVTAQVLKTGAGTLHRIVLGTAVNGATVTVYDATSAANVVALLTFGSAALAPGYIDFNLDFFTGLTVTTSATCKDVTFIYD
jgi:hypothetical protein